MNVTAGKIAYVTYYDALKKRKIELKLFSHFLRKLVQILRHKAGII